MTLRAERMYPEREPPVEPELRAEYTGFRLSWGGIFAGLVVALVVQMILSLLGLAIGLGAANFVTGNLQAVGIGAGIWAVLTALISLFAGGLTAGHLAGVLTRFDGMLHGMLVWGLSVLVGLWALSSGVSTLLGGMFGVAGQTLGAAISGMTTLGATAAREGEVTPATIPTNEQQMIAVLERRGMSSGEAQQAVNEIQQTARQAQTQVQQIQQQAPRVATQVAGNISTAIWWVLLAAILSLAAAAGGAVLTAER